jgi:hypothetical protein
MIEDSAHRARRLAAELTDTQAELERLRSWFGHRPTLRSLITTILDRIERGESPGEVRAELLRDPVESTAERRVRSTRGGHYA